MDDWQTEGDSSGLRGTVHWVYICGGGVLRETARGFKLIAGHATEAVRPIRAEQIIVEWYHKIVVN